MTEVIPIAFSARWGVPVCLVQQNKVKWVRGNCYLPHGKLSRHLAHDG
jgi:hypothetical protein